MAKVGFIGLGIMGSGMVANLVKAGHDVTVWNRTDSKYAAIEKVGAKTVSDPTQLLAGADFLMYCLADDVAVDALFVDIVHVPLVACHACPVSVDPIDPSDLLKESVILLSTDVIIPSIFSMEYP